MMTPDDDYSDIDDDHDENDTDNSDLLIVIFNDYVSDSNDGSDNVIDINGD